MWQDRCEADAGIQPMRGGSPPTTDPDEGPLGACSGHWSLLPEDGLFLPGLSLPVQASLQGPASQMERHPTLRYQTPASLLSNNVTKSSSIWIIHFKRLSGYFRFFFLMIKLSDLSKSLGAADGIATRWPILPRTRWTEANSGASQRLRRPRSLGTALCPFTRPPSSHPEDKGLLSPKQAFLSPTPQAQVLQPPAWKRKSRFSLPKRHQEPSSKLRRAKKTDFLN